MRPISTSHNHCNSGLRSSVLFCYLTLAHSPFRQFNNFKNLNFVKNALSVFASKCQMVAVVKSFFNRSIRHVCGMGSLPKMFGINTCAIIARMTNLTSFKNVTFAKKEANSMGKHGFGLVKSFCNISILAFFVGATFPYPAPVGFFNFADEPIRNISGKIVSQKEFRGSEFDTHSPLYPSIFNHGKQNITS